jgi:hypothetical protein
MELLYIITFFKFWFKFIFSTFLIIFNIYLILTYNKDQVDNRELQSGFGSKNLKNLLGFIGAMGGYISAYITIKNEFKDYKLGNLKHLQEEDREAIRRSIDSSKEEHKKLLKTIEENKEELNNIYSEKTNLINQNTKLLEMHNSIKNKIISFQDKSLDSNIKLSELSIIDQLIKQDSKNFADDLNSLLSNPCSLSSKSEAEGGATTQIEKSPEESVYNIKESSILNINLSYILENFETLNGIKKIAFCLILSKSIILSALISIIFIFYGNILIEKYNLKNKYPKIYNIIQLKQKFQNYYFKFYCILILLIIFTEIIFGISILLL